MEWYWILIIALVYLGMQSILFVIFDNVTLFSDFEDALVSLLWPLSLPVLGFWITIIEIIIICDGIKQGYKEKKEKEEK